MHIYFPLVTFYFWIRIWQFETWYFPTYTFHMFFLPTFLGVGGKLEFFTPDQYFPSNQVEHMLSERLAQFINVDLNGVKVSTLLSTHIPHKCIQILTSTQKRGTPTC
jgi:hypothetical protein